MALEKVIEQIVALEDQAKEIMKGAKALADVLREKKNAGGLSAEQEQQWHDAIFSNVKRAEELRREVEVLRKRMKE